MYKIMILVILLVLAIIYVPLAIIWAINTLFGLSIAFTLKNWAAAMVISILLGGNKYK